MLYKLTLASFIAVAYAASVGAGNSVVSCPGTNSYCNCADDCGQSQCDCAAAHAENCCDQRGQPCDALDRGCDDPAGPTLPDNDGAWKTITTDGEDSDGEKIEWTEVPQATSSPVAQASPSPAAKSEDDGADDETEEMLGLQQLRADRELRELVRG